MYLVIEFTRALEAQNEHINGFYYDLSLLMPYEVITSVKVRGLHCFPGCATVNKL